MLLYEVVVNALRAILREFPYTHTPTHEAQNVYEQQNDCMADDKQLKGGINSTFIHFNYEKREGGGNVNKSWICYLTICMFLK